MASGSVLILVFKLGEPEMAPIKTLFIALALTASSITLFPMQAAVAQGANIVTFDQARVMRDTTGGKDITRKVQAIGNSMKTELETEGRALDTEGRSLETRTANLTREALAADTGLRTQLESFSRKRQSFQQKGQIRQAELQQTEQTAWAEFFKAMQPVVQEVANERGAQIILERTSTAYSAPNLDATDLIISKMNARSPSFTVTRARIQAPQTPAETIQ